LTQTLVNEWSSEAVESSLWDKDARDALAKGFYSDAEMVKRKKAQPLFSASNTSDVSMAIDSVEAVRLISSFSSPLVGPALPLTFPLAAAAAGNVVRESAGAVGAAPAQAGERLRRRVGCHPPVALGHGLLEVLHLRRRPLYRFFPPPPSISFELSERREVNNLQLLHVGWHLCVSRLARAQEAGKRAGAASFPRGLS
jgi:hypothetical protein